MANKDSRSVGPPIAIVVSTMWVMFPVSVGCLSGSLKAMRVLQLALKKIQSLRKDFIGEDEGRRHPITQDKSWESGLLLLVISNRPLLRVMHTGLFQDLPTAP